MTKGVCLGTLGQRDMQSDMRRDASVAFMPWINVVDDESGWFCATGMNGSLESARREWRLLRGRCKSMLARAMIMCA